VAVGDFNGDGKPDLVTANKTASTVSVLLSTTATGATSPTFSAKVDFTTGSNPGSVAVGDFNGDGKPDLATANVGSSTVSVLLNTTSMGATTPSFASSADFATDADLQSVVTGDLNGDGKPDLATANHNSDTVSVLLNVTATGAATPSFAGKVDFATSSIPVSVAIGDFNGDGKPDVAAVNDSVSVLLNLTANGATTPSFAARVNFLTPQSFGIAVGDINADGKPDIATASINPKLVSILLDTTALNEATPSFAPEADFATSGVPGSVAVGDLNGDSKPDLATASESTLTTSILLNTTAMGATTPTFAAKVDFETGTVSRNVVIGDFNLDGKPDLAFASGNLNNVWVLLGQ
jgi:hypothetical protein